MADVTFSQLDNLDETVKDKDLIEELKRLHPEFYKKYNLKQATKYAIIEQMLKSQDRKLDAIQRDFDKNTSTGEGEKVNPIDPAAKKYIHQPQVDPLPNAQDLYPKLPKDMPQREQDPPTVTLPKEDEKNFGGVVSAIRRSRKQAI